MKKRKTTTKKKTVQRTTQKTNDPLRQITSGKKGGLWSTKQFDMFNGKL